MTQEKLLKKEKILAFDYLRTFVIILVVLHHAILAYVTFIDYSGEYLVADIVPSTNLLNPIFDTAKSWVFDIILTINDQYFMSLLFLLSGLFIYNSYERKGTKKFFKDRFVRLGVPFLLFVPTIIPIAYYFAHLQWSINGNTALSFFGFWLEYAKAGFFASGPLWFLWVLLLFNLIVVLLFFRPKIENRIKNLKIFEHPVYLFIALLLISTISFFPLLLIFGGSWIGVGPFTVQGSRVLHYFIFFLFGTFLGMYGLEKTMFKPNSSFTKFWWIYLIIGLISFLFFFPLSCVSLSFATIGFFLRYTKKRNLLMDSLNKNAFGIYIFHYMFIAGLQFILLGINISAITKGIIVFFGALVLSWGFSSVFRKIPIVGRII